MDGPDRQKRETEEEGAKKCSDYKERRVVCEHTLKKHNKVSTTSKDWREEISSEGLMSVKITAVPSFKKCSGSSDQKGSESLNLFPNLLNSIQTVEPLHKQKSIRKSQAFTQTDHE